MEVRSPLRALGCPPQTVHPQTFKGAVSVAEAVVYPDGDSASPNVANTSGRP